MTSFDGAAPAGLESGAPPDQTSRRFPLLDGLRAVAAFSIVAYHSGIDTGGAAGKWFSPLLARLDVGVAVFFVLSGFLLYRPFVAGTVDVRRYAVSRFLRIFPGWWFALAVIGIVLGRVPLHEPHIAIQYVTLVIGWNPTEMVRHGLYQSWTLTIEVTFYAFLPLWALATRRLAARSASPVRTLTAAVTVLGLAGFAFRWWLAAVAPGHFLLIALPSQLLLFAAGMWLAIVEVAGEGRAARWQSAAAARPGLCWSVAGGAFLVLAYGAGLAPQLDLEPLGVADEVVRHALFAVVAFALVLPGTRAMAPRGVAVVAASRVAVALGTVSYGVYLWHADLLRELAGRRDLPGLATFALVAVGSTAVAAVSYLLVERPVLARLRPRAVAVGSDR